MENQRLYILKGNTKNPGWELRNRGVLVQKSDKEGLREIQFVPGAKSIWKEENEKEGVPQSIWFTDGSLSVHPADKVKIEFLEKHPDFDVHYEKYDPEAKSEAEFARLELIEEVKDELRKMTDPDEMSALAASLFGHTTMTWGEKETKLRVYKQAEAKPEEVKKALNDPASEAKYIAAMGLIKKVVMTNAQKTAVTWNNEDKGVICYVPTGQKPLNVLGEFLFNPDNSVTLQEIGNKLEALSGKTPKKKTKSKNEKEE